MAKKVFSWISFGISVLVVFLHMISTFMAPGDDYKAMLVTLALGLMGVICGMVGCLVVDKNKIVSGILLLAAMPAVIFLGIMTLAGGLKFLGVIGLPLSILNASSYFVSAILVFAMKK